MSNLLIGWYLGYRSIESFLAFWLLGALAGAAAWNFAVHGSAPGDSAGRAVRAGVIAFAIVVACGLVLGAAGRLTTLGYIVLETVLFGTSLVARRPSTAYAAAPGSKWPVMAVAIVGALVAFAAAFAAAHSPLTLYDSISYHLFFSARWVQDHALSIVPTPFSDEAQAYAPANGELAFAWLMLPFNGDLVARMGQFPFGLLAATTLYALARYLGAPAAHAAYPAVFFLLSRPVLEQIIGANVDLICAAVFLTSLYLGIVAIDRDERRDWILWGISLGLYCGTKYVALVYMPVFVLLAFARGIRRKAVSALPGIAAFALPWYVRNWVVAGSPIYPASVTLAGFTLARGAFDRGAMLNTVFHTTDVRLFPAMAAHAFGPALLLFWIPFAVVGWAALARRGWWPYGFCVLVPLLMVPLYWFGLPVNVDSRFLMPALAPALLPLAFAFRGRPAWDRCIHALYAAGMMWIIIGLRRELPASLPWYMGGWLALDGLIEPQFLLWFFAVAVLVAAAWRFGRHYPAIAAITAATVLAIAGKPYLHTTSTYIRPTFFEAWRWIDEHVAGSTIAYTGNNLPYPLVGPKLGNRVIYVNIDGRRRWRFHDYDRAYRAGQFVPVPPLLATASGELMPIAGYDALRPRYERMQGIRQAWIFNLEALGVRHLFISALSAYEIDYVWHDEQGFPIEETWASADPHMFRLVYNNSQVRIYAVALPHRSPQARDRA